MSWARNGASAAATESRSETATGNRDLDIRVGTIDVTIPKLRQATYFPE